MLPHKHDLGLGRRPPSRLFSLEAAAFICRFGDGLIRPHAPTSHHGTAIGYVEPVA